MIYYIVATLTLLLGYTVLKFWDRIFLFLGETLIKIWTFGPEPYTYKKDKNGNDYVVDNFENKSWAQAAEEALYDNDR